MLRKTTLIMLLVALAAGSVALAGEEKTPEEIGQAALAAWMEMASPGEHHKHIARMEGFWEVKATFWFAPGMEPQVTKGMSTNILILGKRYLETKYASEVNGMPFAGRGTLGYDRIAGEYVDTWIDNMGTGVLIMRGTCSDDGKTITLHGQHMDPATKETIKARSVTTFDEHGNYLIEMWNLMPDGSEFKSMELAYTRK
ncbi:MAG: DUF1579 domain-containing protein [Acidobacteria bacterium]|uniref:DUF1579 domain-containing protein n=1 Tax=Candidatus Polarisedimenticola svalbardensis TaxID=2886004 RepID=A0A8J7C2Q4_9BACT|nr:DUF1579 domain-containing protein [Candidatus Polarisedimenticola svalbardensis]